MTKPLPFSILVKSWWQNSILLVINHCTWCHVQSRHSDHEKCLGSITPNLFLLVKAFINVHYKTCGHCIVRTYVRTYNCFHLLVTIYFSCSQPFFCLRHLYLEMKIFGGTLSCIKIKESLQMAEPLAPAHGTPVGNPWFCVTARIGKWVKTKLAKSGSWSPVFLVRFKRWSLLCPCPRPQRKKMWMTQFPVTR